MILGLTFWFGVFTLAGIVFVAAPFSISAGLNQMKLPFAHTFWVGVALLLIALGYVALDALYYRRPLRFFRWRVSLPPLRLDPVPDRDCLRRPTGGRRHLVHPATARGGRLRAGIGGSSCWRLWRPC